MRPLPGIIVAMGWLAVALTAASAGEADLAWNLLAASGVKGGLIVHVGCGDGTLTAALHASDSYLVQGLDGDLDTVTSARQRLQALGRYGSVSVERLRGQHLPYADNLVSLVVMEHPGPVPMSEVMRVLAPNGVALIAGQKTVKPWPKEIDEWTHYLHDPGGNAVAHDSVVGPPRHMQWLAEPLFTRAHDQLDSISAIVSQGGRLFSIVDANAIPVVGLVPQWTLVARDAFNGVWLWQRPIGEWADIRRHFRSGPDQLPRLLVATGGARVCAAGL